MKTKSTAQSIYKKSRGFSVIELMVAAALFTIVVAIAATAILTIIDTSHRAREYSKLVANIDFALEDMSRTIRTGQGYFVPSSERIRIQQDENECTVEYQHYSLQKAIRKRVRNCPSSESEREHGWKALTSPDVDISHFSFTLDNSAGTGQPRVIINMVGNIPDQPESDFYMQTSITQRALKI